MAFRERLREEIEFKGMLVKEVAAAAERRDGGQDCADARCVSGISGNGEKRKSDFPAE